MNNYLKKILNLLILVLLISTQCVYATDPPGNNESDSGTNTVTNSNDNSETLKQYLQALRNTARAYLWKGENIQYDETSLTYLHTDYIVRNQRLFAPEDVNDANVQYTVCDHYTTNLFYNTFVDKDGNNYSINDKYRKSGYLKSWYYV